MTSREEVIRAIQARGGDAATTLSILDQVNAGGWTVPETKVASLPGVDGTEVVALDSVEDPEERGWEVLGGTALGILNGGSATSYVDRKKNLGIAPGLGEVYEPYLNHWSEKLNGLPKALAPAFFQPDGSAGADFLELKIRALLLRSRALGGGQPVLFQMTSPSTHRDLMDALDRLPSSPWLADLLQPPSSFPKILTRQQELIGALTPKDSSGKRGVFFYGEPPQPLLLPGGHGQNFRVLAPVYRQLLSEGYEYAYLTNVDNLGALPNPNALYALKKRGADAGFDFSFRTAVDVKGGILFRDPAGRLQCGDLGVAVPASVLEGPESHRILFNCATGVFQLKSLCERLNEIAGSLPLRISEQDKDIGRYAQAEQVTWEIMGLLPKPLVFGVDKLKRFLAAKMVVESFLTSGLELENPAFRRPELASWHRLATDLNSGLVKLLEGPYGLVFEHGRWRPLTSAEVDARLRSEGKAWLSL